MPKNRFSKFQLNLYISTSRINKSVKTNNNFLHIKQNVDSIKFYASFHFIVSAIRKFTFSLIAWLFGLWFETMFRLWPASKLNDSSHHQFLTDWIVPRSRFYSFIITARSRLITVMDSLSKPSLFYNYLPIVQPIQQ